MQQLVGEYRDGDNGNKHEVKAQSSCVGEMRAIDECESIEAAENHHEGEGGQQPEPHGFAGREGDVARGWVWRAVSNEALLGMMNSGYGRAFLKSAGNALCGERVGALCGTLAVCEAGCRTNRGAFAACAAGCRVSGSGIGSQIAANDAQIVEDWLANDTCDFEAAPPSKSRGCVWFEKYSQPNKDAVGV